MAEIKYVQPSNLTTFKNEVYKIVKSVYAVIKSLKLANITDVTATATEVNHLSGIQSNVQTQLNAKAPLASPQFTGTPTAPTPTAGDNSTQIATTAFVKATAEKAVADADITGKLEDYAKTEDVESKIAAAVAASEKKIFGDGELAEAFDTIKEIGDYLKDHDDVAKTINEAIAKKADKTELADYVKKTEQETTLAGYVKTTDLVAMADSEVTALFTDWSLEDE